MKQPKQNTALVITAILGALGVALGAFGAHGLEDMLNRTGRLDTWETAVFYHLVHAVVLLVVCCISRFRRLSWILFSLGVVIFSGSLYVLCLTGASWLGAVTPVGGLLLIAGWFSLAGALEKDNSAGTVSPS